MDTTTRNIVVGAIVLLIVIIVLGGFFYLRNLQQNQQSGGTNTLSQLPTISGSGTPGISNQPVTGNTSSANNKIYAGNGFVVSYPSAWGLLTCNNSQNFELDPISSTDHTNVTCDLALKPVTFLVSDTPLNCPGNEVKIGVNNVTKSKTVKQNGDINYRWCLQVGGKSLDITHRVSSTGSQATSKIDYSPQVESVIGNIRTTPTGS